MKEQERKAKVAKYANQKNMIHVLDKCLAELSKVQIIQYIRC